MRDVGVVTNGQAIPRRQDGMHQTQDSLVAQSKSKGAIFHRSMALEISARAMQITSKLRQCEPFEKNSML